MRKVALPVPSLPSSHSRDMILSPCRVVVVPRDRHRQQTDAQAHEHQGSLLLDVITVTRETVEDIGQTGRGARRRELESWHPIEDRARGR